MSIINDALKKTQENLEQKNDKESNQDVSQLYDKLHSPKKAEGPPVPGAKSAKSKENKSNNFGSILILIAILGGLYFAYNFYYAKDGKNKIDFKKFKIAFPKSKGSSSTPKAVPAREYKMGEVVLNGVFTTGERTAALINNKIYEIGQEINGNKIISISIDKVELMDTNGQITVLTTNQ
jgi:hypothetical protein